MIDEAAHQRNLHLQASEHDLVEDHVFWTMEEYAQHLMHLKAYGAAGDHCRGQHVLDWGCNVGYGMEILAKTAASVSGLDLSARAVEAARQRLSSLSTRIECYQGARCGFADGAFDVVTCLQVLEHVSDYDTWFSEVLRVLRPGGTVVICTPNAALRLLPGMKPWNEFHVHEFTAGELQVFLAGRFEDVTIQGLFASAKLYAIEKNRVEAAKRGALAPPARPTLLGTLKASARQRFPLLAHLRAGLRSWRRPRRTPLGAADLARFSTDDLYYSSERLDESLDLMALCRKPQ